MYDRNHHEKRGQVKELFKLVVELFISIVKGKHVVINEGGIRCLCVVSDCRCIRSEDEIRLHLYSKGFRPNYWIWTSHGESSFAAPPIVNVGVHESHALGSSSSTRHVQIEMMDNMIVDALGVNAGVDAEYDEVEDDVDVDEPPNEEAQKFYNILKETNKLLFPGSPHSKLSICARLIAQKSQFHVPEQALDLTTKMMLDSTPIPDGLPKNFYEVKQLVSKLGLGVKRIDCCVKGCMLFYDNEFGVKDGHLVECKFCQESRYKGSKHSRSSKGKPVLRKAMFNLPIIPRLQKMYASMQTAEKMTWHSQNYERRNNSGELRHSNDGRAWKHFDRKHPNFSLEPRNVRLGLCSDGFTPHIQGSGTPYSCWPIIVTPYNLSPDMCMSKPYMFLAAVIPGSSNPKLGTDIYLQSLIDDLKRLWNGVHTYDISRKQNCYEGSFDVDH